jgi:hypothetical protein
MDGAMHLMVYAPYGRAGIYMLQEFCRRIGIHGTSEEIKDLLYALNALPPGHPLEALLRQAPDFQDESALADALLHPQDRAYSVPQLFAFIERAGLRFGRWLRQAPYSLHCGVVAKIPQVTNLTRLDLAEQYAAIELYRGTMVRHSAIAYRSDNARRAQPVTVADNGWLDYVPLKMPNTICVQDGLPPRSVAVLINQDHSYTDLFLPIGLTEKALFDAIDGSRNIADILESTQSSSYQTTDLYLARSFFEQLWWYDQVVFDASAQKTAI